MPVTEKKSKNNNFEDLIFNTSDSNLGSQEQPPLEIYCPAKYHESDLFELEKSKNTGLRYVDLNFDYDFKKVPHPNNFISESDTIQWKRLSDMVHGKEMSLFGDEGHANSWHLGNILKISQDSKSNFNWIKALYILS